MSLPPIAFHYFSTPLPYVRTLALQERLHQLQLSLRHTVPDSHPDFLLLLQHRPVYTAGRRQTAENDDERARLTALGADYVLTQRGGLITYHGPGQLVGYPLLDLSRFHSPMGVRDYVCRIQRTIQSHISSAHGLAHIPSDNTGVFLDPSSKVASIGIQVRHRLTTHGFSLNVTREPLPWFEKVVACGLDGVKAQSIEGATGKKVEVADVVPSLVDTFGTIYEREMQPLDMTKGGEVQEAIAELEAQAHAAGEWAKAPPT